MIVDLTRLCWTRPNLSRKIRFWQVKTESAGLDACHCRTCPWGRSGWSVSSARATWWWCSLTWTRMATWRTRCATATGTTWRRSGAASSTGTSLTCCSSPSATRMSKFTCASKPPRTKTTTRSFATRYVSCDLAFNDKYESYNSGLERFSEPKSIEF